MRILEDGGYAISDEINIPGEGITDFVFARGWLLEIVDLVEGDYGFYRDQELILPGARRFGVFYSPFTFVRAYARDLKGYVRGIGSEKLLPGLPSEACIFETEFAGEFTTLQQTFDVLRAARKRQVINVNTRPSALSMSAKRLIDENYLIYPSIARIAKRLNVSHEHLSRQFRRDYGTSPSAYLHKLRVSEATFRLSLGEDIIDISYDVGYNDLSRFYKQFRKATHTSPAVCRKQVAG